MRTRIKVEEMTLRQWDHLQDNLRSSYYIPDGAVRVCVEFELTTEMNGRHVEMPLRAFVTLMTQLQRIESHAGDVVSGTATFRPDELPGHLDNLRNQADPARAEINAELPPLPSPIRRLESAGNEVEKLPPLPAKWSAPLSGPDRTCDHGLPVVNETPSVFEGADPVRTYEDGCQSFGPYRNQADPARGDRQNQVTGPVTEEDLPPLPAKWSWSPTSGNGPTCDHGLPMIGESPLVGCAGGDLVRTYEDGCQSAPYRNEG
jgi:hypothetical protein